jgi:hypothetical protein
MALNWFDTIIPTITVSSSQSLSALALGARSLVFITGTAGGTIQIFGISMVGGNQDGSVVTIANVSNTIGTMYQFMHESSSESNVLNRLLMPNASSVTIGANSSNVGSGIGAATFRYFGTIQRWIMMGHT